MAAELKPCPFCGLPGHLEAQFGRQWWVQCENGHSTGIVHTSPAEAEEEWNRRIPAGVPAAPAPSTMGADQAWSARRLSDRKPAHGVDSVDGRKP